MPICRQRAELIPTFKNYSGGFTLESFTAETAKKQDVSQHFSAAVENGRIYVSCTEDAPTGSCTLRLKLRLADGGTMENTARVTVKRIPLKLKLSKTKVTLNKAISDRVSVAVTSATKGFLLDTPQWQLLDGKGKTTAEGALDVSWADGMLTIAVNDQTAFGATYKLQVRAKADAPTQTLTVGIPAESKSTVTSTLKAKGHIDVIRSDSALTLTKTYKNYAGEAALEEQLVFWKVDGKQKVDASHLFAYTGNEDGTFTVTQTGSLKPGGKYQAQLVTSLNGVELCRSKAISLTVKMGNAKLTLAAGDTTLFAGDKQDRAEFEILTGDPTLNGIARIEIKEKKYQGKVQLHSYSDGTFALSAPGLTAKTATVTLNIFLEGNETEKPNASLKLKITLQK